VTGKDPGRRFDDGGEGDAPREERLDGHLVRTVENGRGGAARRERA